MGYVRLTRAKVQSHILTSCLALRPSSNHEPNIPKLEITTKALLLVPLRNRDMETIHYWIRPIDDLTSIAMLRETVQQVSLCNPFPLLRSSAPTDSIYGRSR